MAEFRGPSAAQQPRDARTFASAARSCSANPATSFFVHEVPLVVNNHVTMPSQPEIDPKVAQQAALLQEQPKNEYVKDVGFLAKLLPPEHRIYFISLVTVIAALLFALAKGWLTAH